MTRASLQFDKFTLDLQRLRLCGPSGPINLRPKSFEVLRYLVENAGRIVTKEEVMKAVWPHVTITDESLTRCISEVRQALGDQGKRMVRTAPRRGYVFEAAVSSDSGAGATPRTVGRPSIAVLPFANLSGDPEQDYFADGIVEDLITALSRFRWLPVVARNSSFAYKGRAVDAQQVSHDLGVRYVLEGSVRKAGNRIRIAGQLIDVETATNLWADRYEGEIQDLFDLQDCVTRDVAASIEPRVLEAELARATRKGTTNLDAYDYSLRARPHALMRTRQGLDEAMSLLQAAIEADPNYAKAWAMLALCTANRFFLGHLSFEAVAPDAARFARRAVACDRDDAEVLAIAGYMLAWQGHHEEATALIERAVKLNHHSSAVCTFGGWAWIFGGAFDAAIGLFRDALVLDPISAHDASAFVGIAAGNFYLKRFDEAISWAKRAAAKNPELTSSLRYLAAALAHAGQSAEARHVTETLLARQPNASLTRSRNGNRLKHDWMLNLYIEGLRLAGLPN